MIKQLLFRAALVALCFVYSGHNTAAMAQDGWAELVDADGTRARFPAQPTQQALNNEAQGITTTGTQYLLVHKADPDKKPVVYILSCMNLSQGVMALQIPENQVNDYFNNFAPSYAGSFNAKPLGDAKDLAPQGKLIGREFIAKQNEKNAYFITRIYLNPSTGHNVVATVGYSADETTAAVAEPFFKSLQLPSN